MVPLFVIYIFFQIVKHCESSESFRYETFEYFEYGSCPNIECRPSIFEFCGVSTQKGIGKLFDEYSTEKGFKLEGKRKDGSNTKLKISMISDTENIFCYGLFIQRHLLSLMNTQNIQETGYAIDLLQILEKTELHKLVKNKDFWPLSYDINNKNQRREFFKNLPCIDNNNHLWLFKNNEHRGTGIKFLYNPSNIRKLFIRNEDIKYGIKYNEKLILHHCNKTIINNHDINIEQYIQQINIKRFSLKEIEKFGFKKNEINKNPKERIVSAKKLIAQQFQNTFLINGRYSKMRTYIVILSLNPYIVLHSDGYISMNNNANNTRSNDNDEIIIDKFHVLTTQPFAENKGTECYWSFEQFEQHLNELNGNNLIGFTMKDIRRQLEEAALTTFRAVMHDDGKFSDSTQKKLDKYIKLGQNEIAKSDNNYIWLAIDHLVTTSGKTKMLEINLHPSSSFIPQHCSWYDLDVEGNQDWQCQLGRNITKEIFDVSFQIADRKMYGGELHQGIIEEYINLHHLLIYEDFN